jgi:hypothetical protein
MVEERKELQGNSSTHHDAQVEDHRQTWNKDMFGNSQDPLMRMFGVSGAGRQWSRGSSAAQVHRMSRRLQLPKDQQKCYEARKTWRSMVSIEMAMTLVQPVQKRAEHGSASLMRQLNHQ